MLALLADWDENTHQKPQQFLRFINNITIYWRLSTNTYYILYTEYALAFTKMPLLFLFDDLEDHISLTVINN